MPKEKNNSKNNKESNKGAVEENIKKALEKVRPGLRGDGGDVKFVEWDKKNGIVKVQLQGMCVGCPMSAITLKEGIEKEIKKEVKEVREVISV